MNSRRTIILVVAILMAGLAALGLLSYVRNVENTVYAGRELVDVYRVEVDSIPKGTSGDDLENLGFIAKVQIPVEFAPRTRIADPKQEITGLVAVTNLPQGSVLVRGDFVVPTAVATGVTDRLDERGMVTLTFALGQTDAAAYLIEPGDKVNMLVRFPIEADTRETNGAADPDGVVVETEPLPRIPHRVGDERSFYVDEDYLLYSNDVRYLYQAAEVLAIDKVLPADLGEADASAGIGNAGLITMAVPPEVVQLVLAIGTDNIYLSLVPQSYVPDALPPIDYTELQLPGEDCDRLTPYGAPAIEAGAENADERACAPARNDQP